jgi:hypothetical protein
MPDSQPSAGTRHQLRERDGILVAQHGNCAHAVNGMAWFLAGVLGAVFVRLFAAGMSGEPVIDFARACSSPAAPSPRASSWSGPGGAIAPAPAPAPALAGRGVRVLLLFSTGSQAMEGIVAPAGPPPSGCATAAPRPPVPDRRIF